MTSAAARRLGPGRRSEAGSTTVWFVPLVAMMCLVTVLLAHAVGVIADHRRVAAAADLAALAGAAAAQRGEDACAAAADLAARNQARLAACALDDLLRVRVRVTRPVEVPLLGGLVLDAHAHAGPA